MSRLCPNRNRINGRKRRRKKNTSTENAIRQHAASGIHTHTSQARKECWGGVAPRRNDRIIAESATKESGEAKRKAKKARQETNGKNDKKTKRQKKEKGKRKGNMENDKKRKGERENEERKKRKRRRKWKTARKGVRAAL